MTTVQMLYELRLLLDEATPGMWTDDDCYVALTTAQMEITEHLLQIYKKGEELGPEARLPEALNALVTKASGKAQVNLGTYSFADPFPFLLHFVRCMYGAEQSLNYPCVIRTQGKEKDFEDRNVFLDGVNEEPTVILKGYALFDGLVNANRQQLEFRPAPTSATFGTFTGWFIKKPLDISVSQEPESYMSTHQAIVQRAFVELLIKAERSTTEAYGIYTQMLGSIL